MKNKVIQLCGKVSNLTPEEYHRNFENVERAIKEKHPEAIVINPVKLANHLTEAFEQTSPNYRHYMDICLASLKYADILAVMDNAPESEGAKEEMKEAFQLGKEIMKVDEILA